MSPRPVSRTVEDERRDATRQLLRTPLLLATGPDAEPFARVRRHADHLIPLFRQQLGYRLVVEPGFARLHKAGLGPAGNRPLLRRSGAPFTPRDYLYLMLACATLLTARRQLLLSTLVADIRHASAEAGVDLGADSGTERRALVHALQQLVAWSVLAEDEGDVGGYADDPSAEVLLWVDHELLRSLLVVPMRELNDADELVRRAAEPGPDGVRHAVRRRLVEEPVVAVDELSDEQRQWLRQYQRREERSFEDLFGLRLEIRAEGVAALDPSEDLTDLAFPRTTALGHLALLCLAQLVERLRPTPVAPARDADPVPSVPVPAGLIDDLVAGLLEGHGRRWNKEMLDHSERVPGQVEDLLVEMGLLLRTDGALRLRSVAARYAPEVELVDAEALPPEPVGFEFGGA